MEWAEIIEKCWTSKMKVATQSAIQSMINEFGMKRPLDDDFKNLLLQKIQQIVDAAYKRKVNIIRMEQYLQKASETSATSADSGYRSAISSTVSRLSNDSTISKGELSSQIGNGFSGSSVVNETASHSDQQIASNATSSQPNNKIPHQPMKVPSQPSNKRKREQLNDRSIGENSAKEARLDDNYKCDRCDRSFRRQASLPAHRQSKHWRCVVCEKEFGTEAERDEHVTEAHGLLNLT